MTFLGILESTRLETIRREAETLNILREVESSAWSAGRSRLQRALRVCLLSSPLSVQPVKGLRLLFRGDAAFAKPELYEYLEQGKIGYAIRLPANQVIQEQIQPLLERPTQWPSREPIVSYHDFAYQAQSWHLPRRVVAKVEWHQGELFPRVGFIVTNLSYPPKGIVRFYNGRGTAEQWIKEGKYALNWTRLSRHKFVANQVRLWLFVLTYNLGNFMRRLVLPEDMKHWTLSSLQTRLIKTGGRLVRHARRLVFQLAEVLVTREMLTGILERISRLRLAPG